MRTGGGCLDAGVVGGWGHRSVTRRDVVAGAVLHAVLPQVGELNVGVISPLLLTVAEVTAVAVDEITLSSLKVGGPLSDGHL